MAVVTNSPYKMALLGLWALPGVGVKSIGALQQVVGDLGELLHLPAGQWPGFSGLAETARTRLLKMGKLSWVAESVLEKATVHRMNIAFQDDEDFPAQLKGTPNAPPMLFYIGSPGPPQRRIAMVGTRRTSGRVLSMAFELAKQAAQCGLCVISGAAIGVDEACHRGALAASGRTWAFLGSALDQMDPAQAALVPAFREGKGTFFSEYPPGVRADRSTFPRRNRLISGSAHAVLLVRAGEGSGALHTVAYALEQGRPILAMPGEVGVPDAVMCNEKLRSNEARICLGLSDILCAVGLDHASRQPSVASDDELVSELSETGRRVLKELSKRVLDVDELVAVTRMSSASIGSALAELELMGLVIARPGKRFERI